MKPVLPILCAVLQSLALGCAGEAITDGVEQPIRVTAAQFRAEALPGSAPLTTDEVASGKKLKTPNITSLSLATRIFDAGASGRSLSGRASRDAFAVGLRLEDEGDGYWLVPVSVPDPQNDGEFTWALRFDLAAELPPGRHHVLIAALGEDGSGGTQSSSEICVRSPVPDNLNACTPTRRPPGLVISLSWATAADVDLRVRLPNGEFIDRNLPESAEGRFLSDGNASCRSGLRPREDVVWDGDAPKGTYAIYARLFTACDVDNTELSVAVYGARKGSKTGTWKQVTLLDKGRALSVREPAAVSEQGVFVTEFTLE